MSKFPTFPTLYNNVLTIDMARLKQWGYLEPEKMFKAELHWSNEGERIASISFIINNEYPQRYIELDYKSNDKPRKYKVQLVSVPSNLGKGEVLYFVCPQTNKRCRKLYLISGYFLHRDAFNSCMYESQTKSKYARRLEKEFGVLFKSEKLHKELYSKHFKTHYNGKPTKRYLRIMKQIKETENISYNKIEQLLLS